MRWETEGVDLHHQSFDSSTSADITVDPCARHRRDELCIIHLKSLEQFGLFPQLPLLMVVFCYCEDSRRFHNSVDLLTELYLLLGFGLLGQISLNFVVVPYSRLVLFGTCVSGIVSAPEDFKKLLVCGFQRVILKLDCFGMISNVVVGWIYFGTSSVSNSRPEDSFSTTEGGLWVPKSSTCKSCYFKFLSKHYGSINM